MSKANFFRGTATANEGVFALETDASRVYTKEHMLHLAETGRITEEKLLRDYDLVNGGTMADICEVIAAIDDYDEHAATATAEPTEPVTTTTSVEDPKITDEDGKKVRAALFFDGKTLVNDQKANELVKTFGVDPAKFAYHKYATKNGKIVAGTRLSGDLGDWEPK